MKPRSLANYNGLLIFNNINFSHNTWCRNPDITKVCYYKKKCLHQFTETLFYRNGILKFVL